VLPVAVNVTGRERRVRKPDDLRTTAAVIDTSAQRAEPAVGAALLGYSYSRRVIALDWG
jgi:hypothetical protein